MEPDFEISHIPDSNKCVFGPADVWACPRSYRFIFKTENIYNGICEYEQLDDGRKLIFDYVTKDININVGRAITLREGVGWNGDNWQIDLISRNNILSVVTAINAGLWDSEYVTWRNTANEDKELTVAEFKELAKAVIEKVNQVYLDSFAAKG